MTRLLTPALLLALASAAAAQSLPPSAAQAPTGTPARPVRPVPAAAMPSQVLSTGPYGLLMQWYNAEYEVRASDSLTAGAGASRLAWASGDDRSRPYVNGDVFVRYYPTGTAFNGPSFGLKAGLTRLPGSGTFPGIGFEVNQSLMFNEHFYASLGVGLKRLLRDGGAFDVRYIPTFRFNVGVGF